ncbi:MAG: phosphatidylserine decarboxylase family protein [Candidatus Heimdallarchaeota archaeon]|nr:phosphatidylserine decarboxylase family protein [Candidatus Heimdallarchaeota archaeon]
MIAPRSLRYILPQLLLVPMLYYFLYPNLTIVVILSVILVGSSVFMAWFFRDPKRVIINDNCVLYAPADGIVKYIEHNADSVKIAIRMSPFNVHINRAPIAGRVTELNHSPGAHKNVYFAGAEDKNERNLIILEQEHVKCEILQLTGSFARRIEVWKEVGDNVSQGEKIGMIRFGSQTNIRLILHDQQKDLLVLAKKGDKVKAGISPVLRICDLP